MNAVAAMRRSFDEAQEATGWPAPDMSILSAGRGRPVPMPGDMFGSIWPLLNDLAEGAGSPVDYVGASVLAVAASLIGAKRWVRPFGSSHWQEPCILWWSLVGDPSANKSPAIDAATFPLRAMEAELAEAHRERLADFETDLERAKAEKAEWLSQVKLATKDGVSTPRLPEAAELPDAPERKRLMVMDATPESMGAILAGNPNGTLHLRDELAGWLTGFERYTPGGREFWLEAFGGRPFVIDRKSQAGKPMRVPFNGVSVLGGIQPQKLAETLLNTADDGLAARFLWVWPESVPYHRPRALAERRMLDRVYRRLAELQGGGEGEPITVPLCDTAADVFEVWIGENNLAAQEAAGLYSGFLGKLRGMALRLALVAELIAWAADGDAEPTTVSVRSLSAALAFLDDYAKPTALRVFGDAARPPVERNAAAVAGYIRRHKLRSINARDVRRNSGLPTLKVSAEVDEAMAALVEADWLRLEAAREPGAPGRPKKDYLVNPAVLDG